ncbi:MAG TPA: N-acetyl-gamma-glutamyl-phosphate reductase, partial [Bacillota bacterium]
MITVAVWGATGYAGQELVRLLGGHPYIKAVRALSRNPEVERLSELNPAFSIAPSTRTLELVPGNPAGSTERAWAADVVFCALPHGASAPLVAEALAAGCRVIDLGADFRLRDAALYQQWYRFDHPFPHLLAEAVYGLPEWVDQLHQRRDVLAEAQLVAAPGCYPTGALLGLLPPLVAGLIEPDTIVVDSKSGTSGAGRTPGDALSFSEVYENVRAYGVTTHRHTPEIEQALSAAAGTQVTISFTPHLVPMSRGILTTCYAALRPGVTAAEVEAAFAQAYAGAAFVHQAPAGRQPETK